MSSIHARKGHKVTIVSSDSDFVQHLNIFHENFSIYHPNKKTFLKKPEFDYVMWKALKGDPTDNIAGIKGVGDKTAKKLVSNKKMLTEFLKDEKNFEIFERNVNLIRLVDFSRSLSDMEKLDAKKDFSKLKKIFEDLSFTSILSEGTWGKYCETFERL